jgi:hypothetical protein
MLDLSTVKADLFSVPHYSGPLSVSFQSWEPMRRVIEKSIVYATIARTHFEAGRPEGRRSEFFDMAKEEALKWIPKGTDPATRMFGMYDVTPSGTVDYRVVACLNKETEAPNRIVLLNGDLLVCTVRVHVPRSYGEEARHVFFDITQERLRQAAMLYIEDPGCAYAPIDCPGFETFTQTNKNDDRYYEISFSFPVRHNRKERQNG